MIIDPNDPRLIDLALGELDPQEAQELNAALQAPENAEARNAVREFQQLAGLAKTTLAEEPATPLEPGQREAVLDAAEDAGRSNVTAFPRKRSFLPWIAVAAMILVGFSVVSTNLFRKLGGDEEPQMALNVSLGEQEKIMALGLTLGERQETMSLKQDVPAEVREQMDALGYGGGDDAAQSSASGPESPVAEDETLALAQAAPVSGAETAPPTLQPAPPAPPAETKAEAPLPDGTVEAMKSLGYVSEGDGVARPEVTTSTAPGDAPGASKSPLVDRRSEGTAKRAEAKPKEEAAQQAPVPSHLRSGGIGGAPVQVERSMPAQAAPPPPPSASANAPGLDVASGSSVTNETWEQLTATAYIGSEMPLPPQGQSWHYTGGESYRPIHENAFEQVVQKPLSTFSIDVDTGSYANVRRFLQQGQRPPVDAVRLEELINYFDYTLPQPEGPEPFSVTMEMADCPWAPGHKLARVALQGKTVTAEERGAGNFVFLVDVSGSMDQPNKLPLVRESMKALLEQLEARDRVAIVTYASNAGVALPSTSCSEKGSIRAAIDGLSAGGSTNGAGGIQAAYDIARAHFVPGGVNRVLLATDGDFNVGVTSHDALMQLITEQAKSRVFLTALGYGMGNYKDGTLEQLADKGNGNYAYIDSFAEARKVLVEQINGTLVTIAKDVKIQVEFNPQHVQAYRLLGYENRALAARDFNDDTKDAGEIGAGHQCTALYQIVPAGMPVEAGVDALKYAPVPAPVAESDAPRSPEWMTVKLRYKHPEGDTSAKIEVPWTNPGGDLLQASPDFRFAASVAAFGMILRNSEHKGRARFDGVQLLAQSGKGTDPERQAFVDLVVTAKTLSIE